MTRVTRLARDTQPGVWLVDLFPAVRVQFTPGECLFDHGIHIVVC